MSSLQFRLPKVSLSIHIPVSVFGHVPGFTHFISQRSQPIKSKQNFRWLFIRFGSWISIISSRHNAIGISIGDVGFLSVENLFIFLFNKGSDVNTLMLLILQVVIHISVRCLSFLIERQPSSFDSSIFGLVVNVTPGRATRKEYERQMIRMSTRS